MEIESINFTDGFYWVTEFIRDGVWAGGFFGGKKKNFQQSVIQVVLIGLGLFHDHWALTSQYQVSFRLDQVSKD